MEAKPRVFSSLPLLFILWQLAYACKLGGWGPGEDLSYLALVSSFYTEQGLLSSVPHRTSVTHLLSFGAWVWP